MKAKLYDYLKLFLENKAVTMALLALLLPSVGANVLMSQKPEPNKITLPVTKIVAKAPVKTVTKIVCGCAEQMKDHLREYH